MFKEQILFLLETMGDRYPGKALTVFYLPLVGKLAMSSPDKRFRLICHGFAQAWKAICVSASPFPACVTRRANEEAIGCPTH